MVLGATGLTLYGQLLDALEDEVKAGGCLIDWHACDLFPESWIDLVVVLRVDSTTLYDRLKARLVPIYLWHCVSSPSFAVTAQFPTSALVPIIFLFHYVGASLPDLGG
jgi:hypothetical protein